MSEKSAQLSRPTTATLLARILEHPGLVSAVQALPAPALCRLIDHIGLEDAGELMALATTEQLERVFEENLFVRARAGEDERFDAARFPLWLEVMLEAGERFTAQRLAELPEDLLTLALHEHVLVIDVEAMAVAMANRRDYDELLEKAIDSPLHHEIDQYRLFARSGDGWDAIITALSALDTEHHDLLERILERCCVLSNELFEERDGLYEVLTSEEAIESDVAADREDRREREGFVAARDAHAFLKRARTLDTSDRSSDPLTSAHFRAVSPASTGSVQSTQQQTPAAAAGPKAPPAAPHDVAALAALLDQAELLPAASAPLLTRGEEPKADERILMAGMLTLLADSPALHERRMQELAYVANVLLVGCSFEGREVRPVEAGELAIELCNLGLELRAAELKIEIATRTRGGASAVVGLLRDEALDVLFRDGWRALPNDVAEAADLAPIRKFLRDRVSRGAPVEPLRSGSRRR